MKKGIVYLLTLLVSFVLTSCLETTEELTINEKGSGSYLVNTDLSGFFDMMDMMKSMDTSGTASPKAFGRDVDTLVHMKSFTDTASDLTAEQKSLMRDGTMHLVLNEKKRVFTIDMKYPYSKLSDVQKIAELNKSNGKIMGKALKGKTQMPENPEGDASGPMPDVNVIYDVSFRNGRLEKKINKEKLKEFQSDKKYAEMKQMSSMFSTSSVNTIIHLPKPAKKAEGIKVKLSDDKKTVTIKATLEDIFDQPDILSYYIEY